MSKMISFMSKKRQFFFKKKKTKEKGVGMGGDPITFTQTHSCMHKYTYICASRLIITLIQVISIILGR
jgi:hypothetical protein